MRFFDGLDDFILNFKYGKIEFGWPTPPEKPG
jgi:hypothetical protein